MWEIDLKNQIITFLISLFLGGCFCLCFDIFSVFLRGKTKAGQFLSDTFFFVIVAFVDFCFFLAASNGEIRLYILIGELMGFYLCKTTLSRFFTPFFMLILKMIKLLKNAAERLFFEPVYHFLSKTWKFCLKTGKKSLKFVKKRLKKHK